MSNNCRSPNKCPFYFCDIDGHTCTLTRKRMTILTDPANCRPLIDYQKNHYGKWDYLISIVPESLNLTKLKVYYKSHSDKYIELYIKFPEGTTDTSQHECLLSMQKHIDTSIKSGDIIALLEVAKQFIFENNLKYYEIFTIGWVYMINTKQIELEITSLRTIISELEVSINNNRAELIEKKAQLDRNLDLLEINGIYSK